MGRTTTEGKHLRLSNPKAGICAFHEGKPKNKTMTNDRCMYKLCSLSWGAVVSSSGVEGAYIKDNSILRAAAAGRTRRGEDSIKGINDMSQSGPCRFDL